MASTARNMLLRPLSVIQCCMALCFVVLGIVEQIEVKYAFTSLFYPIWTGVWVGVTGAVGVFMTFRRQRPSPTNTTTSILVITFMGFSLACVAFSSLTVINHSIPLASYATKYVTFYSTTHGATREATKELYTVVHDREDKIARGVVGAIFAITLVELVLSLWSVAACLTNDHHIQPTNEAGLQMVYVGTPGMPSGVQLMEQSPGYGMAAVQVSTSGTSGGQLQPASVMMGGQQHMVEVPTSVGMGGQQHLVQVPTSMAMGGQAYMVQASTSVAMGDQPHVVQVPTSMAMGGGMGGQAYMVQAPTSVAIGDQPHLVHAPTSKAMEAQPKNTPL